MIKKTLIKSILFFKKTAGFYQQFKIILILLLSNVDYTFLLLHLFDKYDEKIYKAIIEQSPFHKLSYKFTEEQMASEGTNYRKLFCEEAKV